MVAVFVKRNRSMIRVSVFFFCVGCSVTLCFLRVGCAKTSESSLRIFKRQAINDDFVEYAVLVLSNPENKDKRDVIRKTWGRLVYNLYMKNGEKLYKWNHGFMEKRSARPKFIQVYFVVGSRGLSSEQWNMLQMEDKLNNDMIFLTDLKDKYENLAFKVKSSIQWFHENIKNLKYLIKCDDDSFVRIDLLVRDLEAFAPLMNSEMLSDYVMQQKQKKTSPLMGLYWGYFSGQSHVNSNSGKWMETDWFLCDYYLPYALGGGYVISRNIVDFIGKNVDLLSCYRSEDVSMGVWTAPLGGINRVHDIRFDTEWESRGCENYMLVRHKQSTHDMFQMYNTLNSTKGKNLCDMESSNRKPHRYDWKQRPSRCCKGKYN